MPFVRSFRNDQLDAEVVIEDDGKTGYAYLIQHRQIVGDVWLYNVGVSPLSPEWNDRGKMPFANPAAYVLHAEIAPKTEDANIRVYWSSDATGLGQVDIDVAGETYAILRPGAKPGWCRLAAKAGPLARPLGDFAAAK